MLLHSILKDSSSSGDTILHNVKHNATKVVELINTFKSKLESRKSTAEMNVNDQYRNCK